MAIQKPVQPEQMEQLHLPMYLLENVIQRLQKYRKVIM